MIQESALISLAAVFKEGYMGNSLSEKSTEKRKKCFWHDFYNI